MFIHNKFVAGSLAVIVACGLAIGEFPGTASAVVDRVQVLAHAAHYRHVAHVNEAWSARLTDSAVAFKAAHTNAVWSARLTDNAVAYKAAHAKHVAEAWSGRLTTQANLYLTHEALTALQAVVDDAAAYTPDESVNTADLTAALAAAETLIGGGVQATTADTVQAASTVVSGALVNVKAAVQTVKDERAAQAAAAARKSAPRAAAGGPRTYTANVWTTGWQAEIDVCKMGQLVALTGFNTFAAHRGCGAAWILNLNVGDIVELTGVGAGTYQVVGARRITHDYLTSELVGATYLQTCYPGPDWTRLVAITKVG